MTRTTRRATAFLVTAAVAVLVVVARRQQTATLVVEAATAAPQLPSVPPPPATILSFPVSRPDAVPPTPPPPPFTIPPITPPTITLPPGVAPLLPPTGGSVKRPLTVPVAREPGRVGVATTCPPDPRPVVSITTPSGPPPDVVFQQAVLESTISKVVAYGVQHSESFGEVRLSGDRVVATFVGDLERHAAALTDLVDRPASVVVCPAILTAADGRTLANEILADSNPALLSTGLGRDGRVEVQVRADHRKVADALVRKHGSRVHVVLGQLAYPDAHADPPQLPCSELPTPAPANAALHWSVEPSMLRVNSGGDLTVSVSWTNTGVTAVAYESGDPITALVTTPGSARVVASYTGAVAGVGHGGPLAPGATDTVTALLSTASCDPAVGWALPPGRYDVYFPFGGFDYTANGGMRADQFLSSPFMLTVTDEPPSPLPTRPTGAPPTFPIPRTTSLG